MRVTTHARRLERLSDDLQLALSQEALRHAAETIAVQAEMLAAEIEAGSLSDQGGPDALRLLAEIVRINRRECTGPYGQA